VSSQVSAPVSTTVIACDIAGASAFEAAVLDCFGRFLAVARSLGFVTQEAGKPNLTLTLAPEQAVGLALEPLAKAGLGFDSLAAPLRLRAMVHYGVVFRTESVTEISYVGSAIRSTQSALRRAPPTGGFLATQDFSAYAAKQLNLPFRLLPISSGPAVEGISQIVFGGSAVAPQGAVAGSVTGLVSADPAFVEFVKRRLTEDIGPFASALVDRAIRSSTAADQLVAVMSREIDNPEARARFEDDVLRYIKGRALAR